MPLRRLPREGVEASAPAAALVCPRSGGWGEKRGRARALLSLSVPGLAIDLLVELEGELSSGGELLEMLALSELLSALVGARVDVVTPRSLRSEVRELALAEAVPL